jgi:flagellar basal body rod protein FlgB
MTFLSVDSMDNTSFILNLIAKKQKVIGENLANVDTPGYVRKDISFGKYLGNSGTTLENKLASTLGPSPIAEERSDEEINPANELMELQKNSLLYSMATRRMSNIINEMKTVINVGK